MLYALVIICAAGSVDQCATFADTRGPYETLKQCTKRIDEIIPIAQEEFFIEFDNVESADAVGWCSLTDFSQEQYTGPLYFA